MDRSGTKLVIIAKLLEVDTAQVATMVIPILRMVTKVDTILDTMVTRAEVVDIEVDIVEEGNLVAMVQLVDEHLFFAEEQIRLGLVEQVACLELVEGRSH